MNIYFERLTIAYVLGKLKVLSIIVINEWVGFPIWPRRRDVCLRFAYYVQIMLFFFGEAGLITFINLKYDVLAIKENILLKYLSSFKNS